MKRVLISSLLTIVAFVVSEPATTFGKTPMPDSHSAKTETATTETATFGGGCFWCMDAQFKLIPGVKSVTSGYAGGTMKNPTYEEVSTGTTGEAEVIQIAFDPQKLSYSQLLQFFWIAHDPTTLNYQGPDHGTQYRSIILTESPAQKAAAEKSEAAEQKKYDKPIVTEIVPLKHFSSAESYHQDYYAKNPTAGYCTYEVLPKVKKFEKFLKKWETEHQK